MSNHRTYIARVTDGKNGELVGTFTVTVPKGDVKKAKKAAIALASEKVIDPSKLHVDKLERA